MPRNRRWDAIAFPSKGMVNTLEPTLTERVKMMITRLQVSSTYDAPAFVFHMIGTIPGLAPAV